jgi:hypothetical protein
VQPLQPPRLARPPLIAHDVPKSYVLSPKCARAVSWGMDGAGNLPSWRPSQRARLNRFQPHSDDVIIQVETMSASVVEGAAGPRGLELSVAVTETPNELTMDIDIAAPVEKARLLRATDAQVFSGWRGQPGGGCQTCQPFQFPKPCRGCNIPSPNAAALSERGILRF